MPAVIVMPHDAPAAKVAATHGYGGSVVVYDRYREDREAIGRRLAEERGMTLIPPYDHPDVIAGQGTAAKELFDEVGALDALFVCLGGGGLLSGSALAARALAPECKVYGVEPEAGNDGQQSFRSGRIVTIETPRTIADGAQTLHLGEHTFPIIRRDVTDIFTATDAELVAAMRFFAERMKMIVEPTGTPRLRGGAPDAGRTRGPAGRHPDQRRQRRPVALRGAGRRGAAERHRARSNRRHLAGHLAITEGRPILTLACLQTTGARGRMHRADRNSPTSPTPSLPYPWTHRPSERRASSRRR